MIVDLPRFVARERTYWDELQVMLDKMQAEPGWRLSITETQRLHYLYERCAADLGQLDAFSTGRQVRAVVEGLVSRAYAEIYETRGRAGPHSWRSVVVAFPRAFRRRLGAFRLAVAVTLIGCAFGALAIHYDPESKAVLMPFGGLLQSPTERVRSEESTGAARLEGHKATFAADLMTHNIRVAVLTFAAGVTWGIGTLVLLFYNGVILGAVAADYTFAGQTAFLAGWLLPHGVVEIPAILVGGQAGLVLAAALIGWGERLSRAERLRAAARDLLTLAGGAGALLIWAGIVEAFVSQYHWPVLPYTLKIGFGVVELLVLTLFLARAGNK